MQATLPATVRPVAAPQASSRAAVIRPSRVATKLFPRPAISAARLRTSGVVYAQLKAPVTFKVAESKVGSGKQLRVVGAPVELGAWDYKAAPKLAAEGAVWSGTVLLPVGEEAEFKFVIYKEADASAEWESIENRTLEPAGPEAYSSKWDDPKFEVEEAEGQVVFVEEAIKNQKAADAEVQGRLNALLKQLAA